MKVRPGWASNVENMLRMELTEIIIYLEDVRRNSEIDK